MVKIILLILSLVSCVGGESSVEDSASSAGLDSAFDFTAGPILGRISINKLNTQFKEIDAWLADPAWTQSKLGQTFTPAEQAAIKAAATAVLADLNALTPTALSNILLGRQPLTLTAKAHLVGLVDALFPTREAVVLSPDQSRGPEFMVIPVGSLAPLKALFQTVKKTESFFQTTSPPTVDCTQSPLRLVTQATGTLIPFNGAAGYIKSSLCLE